MTDAARIMIGISLILIPTIEYGGYFLLSQMGKDGIIRSELQRAYFRAGHAHAGVLVILNLFGQLLVDTASLGDFLEWPVRLAFFLAPMAVSAGFFLGAPGDNGQRGRLVSLIYIGAGLLIFATVTLGLGLVFI